MVLPFILRCSSGVTKGFQGFLSPGCVGFIQGLSLCVKGGFLGVFLQVVANG